MSRANTKVLLVEDSYGDVVLSRRALELDGGDRFELTVAGTLGEGIECLAQGFDAILLDITLPDSVGPETVTRMRAAARDLPIVVLSGAEEADVAESCLRAGADGYEQKGQFAPSELRHIVKRAIERKR